MHQSSYLKLCLNHGQFPGLRSVMRRSEWSSNFLSLSQPLSFIYHVSCPVLSVLYGLTILASPVRVPMSHPSRCAGPRPAQRAPTSQSSARLPISETPFSLIVGRRPMSASALGPAKSLSKSVSYDRKSVRIRVRHDRRRSPSTRVSDRGSSWLWP